MVVLRPCIRKREDGRRLGAETLKPSHCGLVLGLLCQTARVGGGGWWWCILLEVVVVMGIMFTNVSGFGGLGAENPKPSARAQFGAAAVQPVLKGVAGWIQQPLLEYTKGGCGFGESWYGGRRWLYSPGASYTLQ